MCILGEVSCGYRSRLSWVGADARYVVVFVGRVCVCV